MIRVVALVVCFSTLVLGQQNGPLDGEPIWPLVRVFSEAKQFKIAEVGIDQLDM
jgi:hypothetical protein